MLQTLEKFWFFESYQRVQMLLLHSKLSELSITISFRVIHLHSILIIQNLSE
ncbi:hypothetical protein U0070_017896 [Myodes glareolus]|uniref:Maturase K n=1 Tax=Myodes glareolus TaxID=447135 RepID=A0AAW0K9H6_MYOGA